MSLLIFGYANGVFSSRRIEQATYDSVAFRYLACNRHPDRDALPDGLIVPEEIARREAQLAAIEAAKRKIEARAQERYAREKAEFDAKLAARQAREDELGHKLGGKAPTPPTEAPRAQDQINLTDEDSRIMKVAGGGFEQLEAQAVVDTESMLVLVPQVTQAANDKEQVAPMLAELKALPEGINRPKALLADNGYLSEANVEVCIDAGIEPLIAAGREGHHPDWKDRFGEPPPLSEEASPVEKMRHRLKTPAGKKQYALRKQTVEPVFGIIKSVMGFRQFMLRGLEHAQHEWTLVCLAWNLKRMAALRPKSAPSM